MAKNKPYGDNARVGAVKGRSQVYNPKTGLNAIQKLVVSWTLKHLIILHSKA